MHRVNCGPLALLLTAPTYTCIAGTGDAAQPRGAIRASDAHAISTTGSRTMLHLIAAAGAGADAPPGWFQWLPIVGMIAIFWFLIIRPQMKRQKEHQQRVAGLKKGDQVVTQGGLVGKVVKVDDTYAELELARDVRVKAVKATIADLIEPGSKPAND